MVSGEFKFVSNIPLKNLVDPFTLLYYETNTVWVSSCKILLLVHFGCRTTFKKLKYMRLYRSSCFITIPDFRNIPPRALLHKKSIWYYRQSQGCVN